MRVRLHSFRARALLACVPAVGLAVMATAGPASAAHHPANTRAELRTALEHMLSVHPNSRGAHEATLRGTGLKQLTSGNWSGYADTGTGFSSMTAKWKEPKVSSCSTNGPVKAVVFWVGFDGISNADPTVEQDGTGAICGQGTPLTYFSWWEMFPSNSVQIVGATVKPGDNISASVVRSGTKYTLKVTDSTTSGNNVSQNATCAASTCKNQSAEWIGEAPSGSSGELTLPKFSTWTVTSATVKAGSKSGTIKTFPDDEITMNNASPKNQAQPGPLNSAGNSFNDVWKA
jgi:hypothetical protein